MANFAAVKKGLDMKGRIICKVERLRRQVSVEFGGVGIWFEEGNIEDGMQAREMRWKL